MSILYQMMSMRTFRFELEMYYTDASSRCRDEFLTEQRQQRDLL